MRDSSSLVGAKGGSQERGRKRGPPRGGAGGGGGGGGHDTHGMLERADPGRR